MAVQALRDAALELVEIAPRANLGRRLLDHYVCQLTLGVALPSSALAFVAAVLFWISASRVELSDDALWGGDVVMCFGFAAIATFVVWSLTEPHGPRLTAVFATALSLGSALAAMFVIALLFAFLWFGRCLISGGDVPGPGNVGSPWIFAAASGTSVLSALLTFAVYYRAAVRAWSASESRARFQPIRKVRFIIGASFASCALLVLMRKGLHLRMRMS